MTGYELVDRVYDEMESSPNHEPSMESALDIVDWFGFEVEHSGGDSGKIWFVGRECVKVIYRAIYNKDKKFAQMVMDRAKENKLESVI